MTVAGAKAHPPRNSLAGKKPRILSRERLDGGHWRLELEVPPRLRWFDGHFPGHPILPGVAQIDWAIHLARSAFGLSSTPPRIERVKFQRTVSPGDRLCLELARVQESSRLRIDWTFRREEEIVSRGCLEFDA